MILYEALAQEHYERFVEWNHVAESILPRVLTLLEQCALPHLPQGIETNSIKLWMQSQILSAFMEWWYVDCVDVRLFRDQVDYYFVGRFPCGWYVERPDDFPDRSVLYVF